MTSSDWFRRADPARRFGRRDALKLAVAGVLGLSLPECLARAAGAASRSKAKNVLVILEQGGLSHVDTWDPKPDVVADHRSPYRPVATKVPGMRFTELLAKTGRVADKIAVVRSMTHTRAGADAHPNGTQYVLSGVHPSSPLTMPDVGSVVSHLIGSPCRHLPPYVMVPGNHEQAAETRNGFLPAGTKVFKTGGGDLSDPAWKVASLRARQENSGGRFADRRSLLNRLGPARGGRDSGMSAFQEKAFDVLAGAEADAAFDLRRESDRVREKYGAGHRGACYLVGRRLVEAGVRFVTVDVRWPKPARSPGGGNLNWDHHDHIYATGTCELPGATGAGAGRYGIGHWMMMGSVDQAFSALITDLHERGLLAETLVCFVTEFGRTPKMNKSKGRDHWTHAYSIALAGAGVPGGQVIGRSDKEGGYVVEKPHTPEDYAATVYEKLGIDRERPIYTSSNRPVYFGHLGAPIAELL